MSLTSTFQLAADVATEGILVVEQCGPEFRIIYANENVVRQSEWAHTDLVGRCFASLVAIPSGSTSVPGLLLSRVPASLTVTVERKERTFSVCHMELRPLPSTPGSPQQWFVTLRDFPATVPMPPDSESEARYQLLFENQSRPMWLYDDETYRFVDVNRAAIETYGYSRDEFLHMSIFDLRPPEERQELMEYIRRRRESGRFLAESWHHRKKDGTVFLVEVLSRSLTLGGRSMRMVETVDVSQRRALEDQLRQAQKMEAIGQLAGGISHDFNNLLTVINGYSSMLCENLDEKDPMFEDLEAIRRAGERAAGLTRQLLAFSRKQVLQPVHLDLNALVLDMRSMLQRVIREDIALVTDLERDLNPTFADPTQIEQVIMNLVINARDAIDSQGVITIRTANVQLDHRFSETHLGAAPGQYVMLSVGDSGCGIDAAGLARIFEPFYTTKEKGRGTGLGLPTVYGVVRQSEGQIDVESTVGVGTVFKIHLKATDLPGPGVAAVREPISREKRTGVLLLVEDDEEVRTFLTAALRQFGYQVLTAQDGQHAIEVAQNFGAGIDLLITDVVMPKLNGYDLARHMLTVRKDLRILFLSGYAEDSYAGQPLDLEAKLLPKPFSTAELGKKVREMLEA